MPAELPVEINAFKSQQRRWAKGVVQVGHEVDGPDVARPASVRCESSWNSSSG